MVSQFPRIRAAQCLGFALLIAVSPAIASRTHKLVVSAASHHKGVHGKKHAAPVVAHWTPGQRGIDPDRARAIQTALISQSYMTGTPTGEWDAETEAAMQKYQGDHGWQTKLMPDSRALIQLGLGSKGAEGVVAAAGNNGSIQQATNADSLAAVHSILN